MDCTSWWTSKTQNSWLASGSTYLVGRIWTWESAQSRQKVYQSGFSCCTVCLPWGESWVSNITFSNQWSGKWGLSQIYSFLVDQAFFSNESLVVLQLFSLAIIVFIIILMLLVLYRIGAQSLQGWLSTEPQNSNNYYVKISPLFYCLVLQRIRTRFNEC